MHILTLIAALMGLASAIPSTTSSKPRQLANSTSVTNATITREPCAVVSSVLESGSNSLVNASLAYACLLSVPLDRQGDILQLEGIKAFAQFQSTLEYLKDPPEGYLYPAVDFLTSLDQLADNLKSNGFASEYEFQAELRDLYGGAFDAHFYYNSDILQIFNFKRGLELYSVSTDGLALPEVYLGSDVNDTSADVSPVSHINGDDVETWVNALATKAVGNLDPDANYNAVFPVIPSSGGSSGLHGVFAGSNYYQGPWTTFTFKNGSSRVIPNWAYTAANFSGVYDGLSFGRKFLVPQPPPTTDVTGDQEAPPPASSVIIPTTPVAFTPVPSQTATPALKFYPTPYIVNDDQSVAGYFPNDHEELAVLAIPTFLPQSPTQFANVVREFLATAQDGNKKKLIVDLRGNGGGTVLVAYDLFAQLFPSMTPYGATNFRATPLVNDVGSIVSTFYSNVTDPAAASKDCTTAFSAPPFNYHEFLDADRQPFASWEAFFGPQMHHGGNFTQLTRFDLNDYYSTLCTNISNYGPLRGITPQQVFQPEDVVLVQDGACGSTCAVFAEFMKTQAGVRSVVFGGRKQNGPMQGVAGVKGAGVYSFDTILKFVLEAANDAPIEEQQRFQQSYGNLTTAVQQAMRRATKDGTGINMRNNIRYGDDTFTPLQFVYEAADCRLFYTSSMMFQQDLVWDAAYRTQWGNASCVPGSTGHPSSKPSVVVPSQSSNTTTTNSTVSVPISGESSPASLPTNTPPSPPSSSQTAVPYTGDARRLQDSLLTVVALACGILLFV